MAAGRLGSPASVLLPQPWVYQPHGTSDLDRGGIHPVRVHTLPNAAAAPSLRISAASTAGLRDGILPGICGGVRPAHGLYRECDRSAAVGFLLLRSAQLGLQVQAAGQAVKILGMNAEQSRGFGIAS